MTHSFPTRRSSDLPVGNPKKTLQAGELGKTRIADQLAVRRRTDALMVLATAAPTQVQIFTRCRNRPDDDEYDQWSVQPPSDHYADKADDRSDRHLPAEHNKQVEQAQDTVRGAVARSEERRDGKECFSTCQTRGAPVTQKKKNN